MAKVVPAIEAHDVADFRRRVSQIRQLTDRVQMDIVDGEFADFQTVQPEQVEPPTGLKLDIHLMVVRPMEYIGRCIKLRPYTIIVQYEAKAGVEEALAKIKANGMRAGLAINPDTTVDEVRHLFDQIKHILIMGYPAGAPGRKLDLKVLKKPAEIRAINENLEIGLDGGVSAETLPKIAKAGFDVVDTNTYLFDSDSLLTRYHEMIGILG